MPTANHIAAASGPPLAYRVLAWDGSIRPGFKWHEVDDARDVVEVLTSEGVDFDDGKANQAKRLRAPDLAALIGEDVEED